MSTPRRRSGRLAALLVTALAVTGLAVTGLAVPAAGAAPTTTPTTTVTTTASTTVTTTAPNTAPTAPMAGPVLAAVAQDFDPGHIISDSVFFNPWTMTAPQVQELLDFRGRDCVAGEQPCLKDATVTTVTKPADGLCNGYAGGRRQTAAEIIVGVGLSCGINPRVMIVLLEKEQSLITRTRPTTYAYERATGFGCPDTAPCNTEYFGLFNQVYLAARQFQNYAQNPGMYPRYRPGRVSSVLFHPNAACGAADVYIQNQATAGLYTYTPYQPNAAALANLYGVGNSCSSYGNRNFWRMFTDWFGNPQAGSFLVRTVTSPQVYLVSGQAKFPVPTESLLAAYAPLGPVGFVSQNYLDRMTTGSAVNRFVRGTSGAVYLVDEGRKLQLGSCQLLADYGGACDNRLVTLADAQLAALTTGPALRSVARTPSGRTYYVTGGARREVADDASLTAAGISTSAVSLSPGAVAHLPYGVPVMRDGIVARNRSTGALGLAHSAGFNPLPPAMVSGTVLRNLPVRDLDDAGLRLLTPGPTVGPFVDRPSGPTVLLRGSSVTEVTAASVPPPARATLGEEVLAAFTPTGAVGAPFFVQPVGDALRYQVVGGAKLPVRNDAELVVLAGGSPPQVLPVTPAVAGLLPTGRDAALTRFDDVRLTSVFVQEILWLADRQITGGYPDGTFRPSAPVSREAMAAFLYRQAGSPTFTPPQTPTFADVRPGAPFYAQVEWLAARGISTGTRQPDGTRLFEPSQAVSRQAMAAFLHRSAGSPSLGSPVTPTFVDVSPTAGFYEEIEWLAAERIATGRAGVNGTSRFEPLRPVSRQAMAAFLQRFTQR